MGQRWYIHRKGGDMNLKEPGNHLTAVRPAWPRWKTALLQGLAGLALLAGVTGCHTIKDTTPARTATEQLLLSAASERALTQAEPLDWLKGKRVFVEDKYFESYDKGQAVGVVRERLSAAGCLLADTSTNAEIIVEIRSAALSIDDDDYLVGLPSLPIPIPFAGTTKTPEIPLYKAKKFDAIGKVALFGYDKASGRYIAAAGPIAGRAYLHRYSLLFISWRRTDVPELPGHHPKPPRYPTVQ